MLEFGDRAQDLEEHAAHRGGGVDALVEHDQVDALGLQPLGQLDEVLQGAAEPVELGHHELVAIAGDQEGFVEFGASGELAGRLVGEDLLAAGRAERVLLRFGMLITSADPGHADSHAPTVTRTG